MGSPIDFAIPTWCQWWCIKQHSDQSTVRLEASLEAPAPAGLVAKTTASASSVAF